MRTQILRINMIPARLIKVIHLIKIFSSHMVQTCQLENYSQELVLEEMVIQD